jgi:hypothetical protein
MENQSNIQKNVMRRVRTIHTLRPFVSGVALASVLAVLALWGIGREVWVARVFENMPSIAHVTAVAEFFALAFVHTRFVVQALTLTTLAAVLYAVYDAARLMRPAYRFA